MLHTETLLRQIPNAHRLLENPAVADHKAVVGAQVVGDAISCLCHTPQDISAALDPFAHHGVVREVFLGKAETPAFARLPRKLRAARQEIGIVLFEAGLIRGVYQFPRDGIGLGHDFPVGGDPVQRGDRQECDSREDGD